MLRAMNLPDLEKLREIHARFYSHEFSFPDFQKHFLNAFIVEEDGQLVVGAGVKLIPEIIAITNKEMSARARRDSLLKIYEACIYTANKEGFNELHAFVQDEKWKRHLLKSNFRETKGDSLVLTF